MTAIPADLTFELRLADGTSAEYCQTDGEHIQETLHALAGPRFLVQPYLAFASEHAASIIPCRRIDMILARTPAPVPPIFPLTLPAGQLDIVEASKAWPDNQAATAEADRTGSPRCALHTQLEIHTLGGWMVNLKVLVMARGNVHDERQLFAHLLNLPGIPFRLREGGIGIINPANITRVSAWPKPDALPGNTLPLALRRWTPSHSEGRQTGVDAPP